MSSILENVQLFSLEEVHFILKKYSPNAECTISNYCITKASKHMLGFLAHHYRLNVEYSSETENAVSTISFFIKAIPRVYEKAVYEKILLDFGGDEGVHVWRPKLVASFDNEMIFPDLSTQGYKMKDKLQYFDKEHCLVALTSLAKFHAQSIIIEEHKTKESGKMYRLQEYFDEYLDKASYRPNGPWFSSGMTAAFYAIAEFSKYGKKSPYFTKIEAEWPKFIATGIALANPDENFRNVVCHRDLWTNNLMFHYDVNRSPDGCIILDYQAVRCQPPAADVMAFIYLNTNKAFRNYNLGVLQDHYYMELKNELLLKSISFIALPVFLEACEKYRKWALLSSAALGPQIWIDNKKISEVFSDSNAFVALLNVDRRELIKVMMEDVLYKDWIYWKKLLISF